MFISFFLFKKEEQENNKNISIILETNEGNIEASTYPDKEYYEYSNINCKDTSDDINVNFNKETWKLNLSIEEEKVDGKFNCIVHFKQRNRLGTEVITSKYKENNTDGLIRLEQPETEQTPALVEYRYSGSNEEVKNYVEFNNETWRIIGVSPVDNGTGKYESKLKIMREESISGYSWDTSSTSVNSGYGINQRGESGTYEGADLMRLLNSGYSGVHGSLYWNRKNGTCYNGYNNLSTHCDFSETGLTEEAKSMIGDAKWYTAISTYGATADSSYKEERANKVGTADTGVKVIKTFNWLGKVGLIYLSDYGYASSGCRAVEEILYNYNNTICKNTNWMYNNAYNWTLTPYFNYNDNVFTFHSDGRVNGNTTGNGYSVRPCIYLKPEVKITSGEGTLENPYSLSL